MADRAQGSQHRGAVVEPYPDVEIGVVHGLEIVLHPVDSLEGLQSGIDGTQRRLGFPVGPEDCHHPVADELVDIAAVALDHVAGLHEVAVQDVHHIVGRQPRRQFSEVGDVAEEDRDIGDLSGARRDLAVELAGEHHVGLVDDQPADGDVAGQAQLAGETDMLVKTEPVRHDLLGLVARSAILKTLANPDAAGRALGAPAAGMGEGDAGPDARGQHGLALADFEADRVGIGGHADHGAVPRRSRIPAACLIPP